MLYEAMHTAPKIVLGLGVDQTVGHASPLSCLCCLTGLSEVEGMDARTVKGFRSMVVACNHILQNQYPEGECGA